MKPEELRIGNWFERISTGEQRTAFPIDIVGEYQCKIAGIEGDYKPIPITKEWLLKFGFTEIYEDFVVDGFGNQYEKHRIFSQTGKGWDGFNVHFVKSSYGNVDEFGIVAMNDGDILRNVEHVHQLQNLYFALTGKDLIVK